MSHSKNAGSVTHCLFHSSTFMWETSLWWTSLSGTCLKRRTHQSLLRWSCALSLVWGVSLSPLSHIASVVSSAGIREPTPSGKSPINNQKRLLVSFDKLYCQSSVKVLSNIYFSVYFLLVRTRCPLWKLLSAIQETQTSGVHCWKRLLTLKWKRRSGTKTETPGQLLSLIRYRLHDRKCIYLKICSKDENKKNIF